MTKGTRSRTGGSRKSPSPADNAPSDSKSKQKETIRKKHARSKSTTSDGRWFTFKNIALVILAIAVCLLAIAFSSFWLKSSHFTAPLTLPKVIDLYLTNQSSYKQRLWGSYRSNVYFGLRPKIKRSLIAGLAWVKHSSDPRGPSPVHIRHTCEHGDGLNKFGWIRHDGATFGQQEIIDGSIVLTTEFLVNSDADGGDSFSWTARIRAQPRDMATPSSLIFYLYNERDEKLEFSADQHSKKLDKVFGSIDKIGDFEVNFSATSSKQPIHGYLATRLPKIIHFPDFLRHFFQKGSLQLPGEAYLEDMEQTPNLIAYQISGALPMDVEVVFSSGTNGKSLAVSGKQFDLVMAERVKMFDSRFESTFPLQSKGFSDKHVEFAKAAFSNLLGGVSYFFGRSRVMNEITIKPLGYFPAPLLTAVPSRSFFPRGFLWDEGFHQLLVARFDIDISKDILGHWLDLMNVDGWIPREQILGDEALSKVPREFLVQHNSNGNPPTLFLAFDTLLDQMEKEKKVDIQYLKRVYPRLKKWFSWFDKSQVGPKPLTFRWKGRNSTTNRELNPKTLTSGLDDYPRASHPSDSEYHVDLRCWMTLALRVLCRLAKYAEEDSSSYEEYYNKLSDVSILDRLHWDTSRQVYSDYGNHTSNVKLVIDRDIMPYAKVRKVKKPPSLGFVNSFGYVNLFPLLMNLIPPDSPNLGITLDHLRNESLIWSKYGLRSVAKNDPLYGKANTDQDQPYWRGAIWININYLTVKALYHYGNTDGPYRERALGLYSELRSNLINNMFRQYQATGYIWEQYNDKSGAGKGTHPFTGWSSLVVLIMAEQY